VSLLLSIGWDDVTTRLVRARYRAASDERAYRKGREQFARAERARASGGREDHSKMMLQHGIVMPFSAAGNSAIWNALLWPALARSPSPTPGKKPRAAILTR
jgi:hypothetical protein